MRHFLSIELARFERCVRDGLYFAFTTTFTDLIVAEHAQQCKRIRATIEYVYINLKDSTMIAKYASLVQQTAIHLTPDECFLPLAVTTSSGSTLRADFGLFDVIEPRGVVAGGRRVHRK